MDGFLQRSLFVHDAPPTTTSALTPVAALPGRVSSLADLVSAHVQFRTVYADPPWDYDNRASRGAARNHYRTMTLEQIRAEPPPQESQIRAAEM